MRTIEINLIGELNKKALKLKPETKSVADVDPKTRLISVVMVVASALVFMLSFGGWLATNYLTQKANDDLENLKAQHEKIKGELEQVKEINKNIKDEKQTLELQALAQTIINDSFVPWHNILSDLSNTIPPGIEVQKIYRTDSTLSTVDVDPDNAQKPKDNFGLAIEGRVNTSVAGKVSPISLISFFILNINENTAINSHLYNSKVTKLKHEPAKNAYEFSIESRVKIPNDKTVFNKVNQYNFKIDDFSRKNPDNKPVAVPKKQPEKPKPKEPQALLFITKDKSQIDEAVEQQRREFR